MTKIDIVSGFLGAGKTTLIKKMVKEAYQGEKLVLIENEFGEISIDGGFLKDAGIQISEMSSGCICCSLVGDFGKALREVKEQFQPDRILIEPSGVGKLSDVIVAVENTVADIPDMKLNSFVTVADAGKVKVYMKNFGEFYNNQIEAAGTIILSRTQKLTQEKLEAAVALLREKNPTAAILTTPWDQLDGRTVLAAVEKVSLADELLEKMRAEHEAEEAEHHHHHHEHDHDDDHDEQQGKALPWEDGSKQTIRDHAGWRFAAAAVFAALLIAGGVLRVLLPVGPVYRGELTVAQFAENYNRIQRQLGDAGIELDENGRWKEESSFQSNGGTTTVMFNHRLPQLEYQTENGVLTGIVYHAEGGEADSWISIPSGSVMQYALFAFAGAEKGHILLDKPLQEAASELSNCVFSEYHTVVDGIAVDYTYTDTITDSVRTQYSYTLTLRRVQG